MAKFPFMLGLCDQGLCGSIESEALVATEGKIASVALDSVGLPEPQ